MTLSAPDFAFVQALVRRRSGMSAEACHRDLTVDRLTALAERERTGQVADLLLRVRAEPSGALAARVVEALTTNETSFYRDGAPFRVLSELVVPEIVARERTPRAVSVWSAATASGQEAWSIAMTLRESLPPGWTPEVLGTDINEVVLGRARAGRYSPSELARGLPPRLLARYFTPGAAPEVGPSLRPCTTFRTLNLAGTWPILGPFDVVFLRNVLIYLDNSARRVIFSQLRRVLAPDGVVFLGTGEQPPADSCFKACFFEKSLHYRLGGSG